MNTKLLVQASNAQVSTTNFYSSALAEALAENQQLREQVQALSVELKRAIANAQTKAQAPNVECAREETPKASEQEVGG